MILVVAEKNSVAETIAQVLGGGVKKKGYIENSNYLITWCVGHLVSLAEPGFYDERYAEKQWRFEYLPMIPKDWRLVPNNNTKAQLNVIKSLMYRTDVTEIVCATDAGREGECIFRYVYYYLKCQKPVKRLWTSSLESSAIRKAFSELKNDAEYNNLFMAGYARAKADWLVGMNATRLFSIRYKSSLSVGRVQTPTLAMIVERDNKIRNFVKEKYFKVNIDCGDFIASSERIDDEYAANQLAYRCNGEQASIADTQREEKQVSPPKLYDLTTLQRDANRICGFTAQQTLDYTQSLYEKKLVTYPRTDSQYIIDDMEQTVRETIGIVGYTFQSIAQYISANPNINRCINNKKVSDHHAILPTKEIHRADLSGLSQGEQNILFLVSSRLLVSTSESYIYESIKITVECENHDFYASGTTVIQYGFKVLEKAINSHFNNRKSESKENVQDLKNITAKVYPNVSAYTSEHYTSPPEQYTDGTLLKAMETAGNSDYDENADVEKKGLGTPATRANIIETLLLRKYIKREKKSLIPTEKGINLIKVVPDEVKSPKMTAQWETILQSVEKGERSSREFTSAISEYVIKLVNKYSQFDSNFNLNFSYDSIGICPKCGKKVIDFPKAYSCESGKNGCGFVIWKKFAEKKISLTQAKKLLSKGKSDLIKGFKKKTGETFDTYLIFDSDYTVKFANKRK